MTHDAAELRARVRIEDVIAASEQLAGSGRYLRGAEHDSLVIDTKKQLYNWNSQGHAGDVYNWLQNRYRMTFTEAVQALQAGAFGAPVAPAPRPVLPPEPPPPALPSDLHLQFYRQLSEAGRAWWYSQGIGDDAINHFWLGECEHPKWGRAYTIPVIEAGRLMTIRLRLANPEKPADKYRPWLAGYGAHLFNGDILTPEQPHVCLVAGEKKAIVLWQYNIQAISSTAGCAHFPDDWITRLTHVRRAYICFDPGEHEPAWKLAERIGGRAVVVSLPDKPDDLILQYGRETFRTLLRDRGMTLQERAAKAKIAQKVRL